MKGKGQPSGKGRRDPAAIRRLGLLVFGATFLALFVIVAVSEGVGDPSIPSGDVALVENAPGDVGEVTQEELDHALELAAAQAGEEKAPKPGDPKYDELKDTALNGLFETIWIQALAAEEDIDVSDAEIAKELKKVKKESFPTKADFQKFLNESGFTPADVRERVKVQILSAELQEQIAEEAPEPSDGEVESYYEAAKATQFTTQPSRDLRLIVSKEEEKAEKALTQLEEGNAPKDWSRTAKEFSEDPATKGKGGVQEGVQEATLEEPLNEAVFNAPEGQIEGPIDAARGFTVFEVTNSYPESVQDLKDVESQIESTLAQRLHQEHFDAFVADFTTTWLSRTFCASGYVMERCANYEGDGHPATAPPACYEADPEGGRPADCPAPVTQAMPAMPGSVTPLEPQGKPLAQRPQPMPAEGEAAATEALPEGVPPSEVPAE